MSWHNMDENNTRQEIVKCVVVGDTAVGKTRLICARACNAYLTLPMMLATHIPTVWAIDQYRIHKEVLRRSWMLVDGVNVSLRLWDTFGDHEKDRKFAYGRSDVVLLCFSVSNPQSLKNCKTKWFSEIRQYCPQAPIVLVGCKNDLRHTYRDETFLKLLRERSPFVRIAQESDMITREQGRKLAEEIGAVYYETSVLTRYGVEEVFENAMRLALIARRQQRFWVKSLKNVGLPLLQKPYCPPEPKEPEISITDSTFENDIHSLLVKGYGADVTLTAADTEFKAHKIILAVASSYFHQLFISSSEMEATKRNKNVTLTVFQDFCPSTVESFLRFLYSGNIETETPTNFAELYEASQIADVEELQNSIRTTDTEEDYVQIEMKRQYIKGLQKKLKTLLQDQELVDVTFSVDDGIYPAHRSILMARCVVMKAMLGGFFKESFADVILFPGVSREIFGQCLNYLYTDCVDESINIQNCLPVIELANRLCLPHFVSLVENHIIRELSTLKRKGADLSEYALKLLEPCQIHNAHQLAEWCQYYIILNYKDIILIVPRLLFALHPDNQAYLNKNRWPPTHYLKEQEYYERCVRERNLQEKPSKFLLWETAKKKLNRFLCSSKKSKATETDSSELDEIIRPS